MSTSGSSDFSIDAWIEDSFSREATQAVLDLLPDDASFYHRYGGYTLRRGDYDASWPAQPATGERAVGLANGPLLRPGLTIDPTEEQRPTISIWGNVARLQADLWTLGFGLVREIDGVFGPRTEQAVREFQIYAGMERVAQEDPDAEGEYMERLSSMDNPEGAQTHYDGPISGVVNEQTRTCLTHWINEGYRCPVVIAARTGENFRAVYDGGAMAEGADPENLWGHDDLQSTAPRVFAVDFTGHYAVPTGGGSGSSDFTRDGNDYITLGEHNSLGGYEGPVLQHYHAWDGAEITPQRLTGTTEANLSDAEKSTYAVVRAVADVECNGYLDSLNAYDNAVLSAGPFHWTLAVFYDRTGEERDQISEGELCAFLAYLRSEYEDAYEQFFGMSAFGVRPSEEWDDNGEALFDSYQRTYTTTLERRVPSSDGTVEMETMPLQLEGMSLEEGEAEWLYFRNWHWFYRFVMAFRLSEDVQEASWDFARLRLPAILEADWPEAPSGADWSGLDWTDDATVGDVFTSEKAVAMLLRWHVFRPLHISAESPERHRKLEDIFETARTEEGPHLDWEQNPSNWGDEHEQILIESVERQAEAEGIANNSKLDRLSDNLEEIRNDTFEENLEGINFDPDYFR